VTDNEKLWKQIYDSFKYHRTSSNPDAQSAMDRIAMKCLALPKRESFNPTTCTVWEGVLSADSLHDLKLYHRRSQPHHLEGPIIVLIHKGEKVVIEGNNRVNAWIERQLKGPFSVIFVEPRNDTI
jgi:hypothetical protein